MLAITTTEAENIETAVDGVESLLKGFQSDADKRVTDAVAKAKKEQPAKQESKGGDTEKDEPKKDEMPEWAKTLLSEVTELKKGKTIDTRKHILETKLEKVTPALKAKVLKDFSRMTFETEDEFNAYVAETETDLGELMKAETEKKLGASGKPFKSSGSNPEASKEEVEAIVNEII